MAELEQAIRIGNVDEVQRLIENLTFKVNATIDKLIRVDGFKNCERLLSFALRQIKSEKDEWFKISHMLLCHKSINVNADCRKLKDTGRNREIHVTVLGYVCDTHCESKLGVRMLL